MFTSFMRNGIYYTDIHNMRLEDFLKFQSHGFPKDFAHHKDTKYMYVFPLVKNNRFSMAFRLCVANKIEEIFDYAESTRNDEEVNLNKENNCECYPKYFTTEYKRGYRLGETVWILENPDYKK